MKKSRLVGLIVAATLAVTGSAVGFAQIASAGTSKGAAPLTVVKTVSGPVPDGTTFTATIQCDGEIIYTSEGDASQATVTFDASGQPTSPDTVTFDGPGSCTVTETADGGAETTTYACDAVVPDIEGDAVGEPQSQVEEADPVCEAAGPQTDPITMNVEYEEQQVTVTIANSFPEPEPEPEPQPEPAAQVVAAPTFTG